MTEYDFHPGAEIDLIWDYIAGDSILAADRMIAEIIAVMHGHRSPRVMAAILRDREVRPDP